jgi:type I restriction enzyme, S subunit
MKMETSYKLTEVGPLPDVWECLSIGDLMPFVTSGSRGWAEYYSSHGSPFIRITNLTRESIHLDLKDLKFVRLPPGASEGTRTQLQNGDVLISITADVGIIGHVSHDVPKPAYINQHISLVRFDKAKVDSEFVCYFLSSETPQKLFKASSDNGAKAGLNLTTVRRVRLAVPPLPEQRAIAEALGDVDGLIGALEKLIAKKRDIKQAAMQQLLTGRTRFPGFGGEWKEKRIGEIAPLQRGFDLPTSQLAQGPFPVVYSNGIANHHRAFQVRGQAL